jgi:hypothetical protein
MIEISFFPFSNFLEGGGGVSGEAGKFGVKIFLFLSSFSQRKEPMETNRTRD